jgi:glutamine phosphoribosylpyrophosphate amidotransferase
MCGIIGYLERRPDTCVPVGRLAEAMLRALGRRGPDSAGVAIYGEPEENSLRVRVALPAGVAPEAARAALVEARRLPLLDAFMSGPEIELRVMATADVRDLERAIEAAVPGAEVLCAGRRLRLLKQVGLAPDLEATYGISALPGSHFIGHTRMATESRVDLSHSQPFWAHGTCDLAVVHNGHITNYHQLRRRYEQRGHRFYTENDSEIIGVYLARKMRDGTSLGEALEASVKELDGSFSYVAATATALGYAKDPFCLKPLIVGEGPDAIAIANEELAIHAVLSSGYGAREAGAAAVAVWEVRRARGGAPRSRRVA